MFKLFELNCSKTGSTGFFLDGNRKYLVTSDRALASRIDGDCRGGWKICENRINGEGVGEKIMYSYRLVLQVVLM